MKWTQKYKIGHIFSIFILCLLAVQVLATPLSLAQEAPVNPGTSTEAPEVRDPAEDGTTCAIEKIGWILCPVIEGAAKIGDAAFSVLADNFLQVEPELVGNDVNGTRGAWEMARNIANVMFIIAFIIIIYSQITGAGLSNYGIKKMLPRLILAAILVNISYYICQGLVDISNFLGYVIKDTLSGMAAQINDRAAMPPPGAGVNYQEGGTLGTIALAGLALGAIWLLLPVLIPMVGLVIVTTLIIIVVLLLRKAIIIMLVVISPVAFVAYLLPNTEKLFDKWRKMFWQLLMVFPVVALLFGSGQLASAVILAAGQNTPYTTPGEKCVTLPLANSPAPQTDAQGNPLPSDPAAVASAGECGDGSTTMTLGLVAAGIAVAPLLAVWSVLQGALAAAGAIGGRVAGAIQKNGMSKGALEKSKALGERMDQRRGINALNNNRRGNVGNIGTLGKYRRNARREAINAGVKSEYGRAQQQYVANSITDPDDPTKATAFGQKVAGGGMLGGADPSAVQRALASAKFTIEKAELDEVKAAHLMVENLEQNDLNSIINAAPGSQPDAKLAAALERLVKIGGTTSIQNAVNKHGGGGKSTIVTKSLANALAQDGPGFLKASNIDAISRGQLSGTGNNTFEHIAAENIENGVYSEEKMVSANGDELQYASHVTSAAGQAKLQATATSLQANPNLRGKIKHNATEIAQIGNAGRTTNPPRQP